MSGDRKKPLELLSSGQLVKICAPMVRYSRNNPPRHQDITILGLRPRLVMNLMPRRIILLPFRCLVRKYNCDIAFTPMIVSDSFVKSSKARDNDLTTTKGDRPLIVQFAANNPCDLADAAELVSPFCNGVDLNCGCPQRWAMQEGYGSCLINKPQLVSSIVAETKNRIPDPEFTVSVKIRIHDDLRRTVSLCRQAAHAGASFITVHGRTPQQRAQPVNTDAIRTIKDSVQVPVIANGDLCTLGDCESVREATGVDGVMSARGILANPAMFAGYDETPLCCVQDWVDVALGLGTPFSPFHNHLIYMLENVTNKVEKRIFNSLCSTSAVLDYLSVNYGIKANNEIERPQVTLDDHLR